MHAVVSLLEDQYYELTEMIWAKLKQEFGVTGIYVTPFPHFSYQVASYYDIEKLNSVLQTMAQVQSPFKIRTSGLGVFTGQHPVIYIPVVRNSELSLLHENLWQEMSKIDSKLSTYYHPQNWMPHITLGYGDITQTQLSEIVPFLNEYDFNWEMTINHFALIYNTGIKQEVKFRYPFSSKDYR